MSKKNHSVKIISSYIALLSMLIILLKPWYELNLGVAVATENTFTTDDIEVICNQYQYYHNSYWTYKGSGNANSYIASSTPVGTNGYVGYTYGGGSQCWAFARFLGYKLTGASPGYGSNGWENVINSATSFKIGDIVEDSSHTAMVYKDLGNGTYEFIQVLGGDNNIIKKSKFYSSNGVNNTFSALKNSNKIIRILRYKGTVSSSGSPMSSGAGQTIPDGNYVIANAGQPDKTIFTYLDIYGTEKPAASHRNVSITNSAVGGDLPEYEVWTVTYLNNGFYSIKQCGTNMSLDVSGTGTENGANIQVYNYVGTNTQQWSISKNGRNGYRIQAKSSGFSLDVQGGGVTPETNVEQYTNNDTNAQSWFFVPWHPEQPISDGRYILLSALNEKIELDVSGDSASIAENTNVQIWNDAATSQFNSFDIKKLDNGYYSIIHAASGKALDVTGGGSNPSANIAVHTANGSIAQQWAITKEGDYYVIRAKCSGYALAVQNSGTADGTNVLQYYYNIPSTANQQWKFILAETQINYDANGGSGAPSTQTKYYKKDLKLSSVVPTRAGYEFAGWNTQADGKGQSYFPGGNFDKDYYYMKGYSFRLSSWTLYAQWNEVPVVTQKRLSGTDRFKTGIATAEEYKSVTGATKFTNIVVASGINYPDALSGSYLAAKKNAPMLLVSNSSMDEVTTYIKNNLSPNGTIYVLGGTGAVSGKFESAMGTEYANRIVRLAGLDRYETNLLILKEAGVANDSDILVCTGVNYADSLSASATGKPILLVKPNGVSNNQKAYLNSLGGSHTYYLIGGPLVVPETAQTALSQYGTVTRLSGINRYATSVAVANQFFKNSTKVVLAYGQNYPDGLSAGPLAYISGAPLLLAENSENVIGIARTYITGYGKNVRNAYVIGGEALISDGTAGNVCKVVA